MADELAIAIWLHQVREKFRIKHRLFRRLMDSIQSIQILLDPLDWTDLDHYALECGQDREGWDAFKSVIKHHQGLLHAFESSTAYKRFDIQILTSGHPDYPRRLKTVDSAPGILYARGQLQQLSQATQPWLTVIGTRQPTLYGQLVTQAITRELSKYRLIIVSGLALGIDTVAHETALEGQTLSVAVLAGGLDHIYPNSNQQLARRLIEQGALLSEHPPGVQPLRQYFPARNRILSGLSDAVAVMEAAKKSGTMITAGFAADQGRDVFAVPGNILDRASAGCHHLIRDGAMLLDSAEDILKELGLYPLSTHALSDQSEQKALLNPSNYSELSLDEWTLLNTLRQLILSPEQIASEINRPLTDTLRSLSKLELKHLVQEQRGRYALTGLGQSSI